MTLVKDDTPASDMTLMSLAGQMKQAQPSTKCPMAPLVVQHSEEIDRRVIVLTRSHDEVVATLDKFTKIFKWFLITLGPGAGFAIAAQLWSVFKWMVTKTPGHILIAGLLLGGCMNRETSSVERRVGVEAGKPVDLTITREEKEKTTVDLTVELASVKEKLGSLSSLVRGDLPGMVAGLIPKPKDPPPGPTPNEIAMAVADRNKPLTGNSQVDGILQVLLAYLMAKGGWAAVARRKKQEPPVELKA